MENSSNSMETSDKDTTTVYCLPFAGGNTLSYRSFQNYLSEPLRLCPIELPGRGRRITEPLLTDLEAMAQDILQQIADELPGKKYALYGHSMGALLAYLLTKHILFAGLPAPAHLFCSGRQAPSVSHKRTSTYQLPKQRFFLTIKELGGFSEELLANAEFMDFVEPILRADFQAVETYKHQPVPPLNIPITLLAGEEDQKTPYENLLPWQEETNYPINIEEFSGGHFFLFDHIPQITELFSKTLL